jgi:hypothetical protein
MYRRIRVVCLNPIETLLQLMEVRANEGYRTRHLTINTPTIHTHTYVTLLLCFLCDGSNIFSLTATCYAMHHKYYRPIGIIVFCLAQPIQTDMPTISKEDSLSLEGYVDIGRVKVIT